MQFEALRINDITPVLVSIYNYFKEELGKWELISLLLHHNRASHSGAMQNVIDLFGAEAARFVTLIGEECIASTCEDVCSKEGHRFAKSTTVFDVTLTLEKT